MSQKSKFFLFIVPVFLFLGFFVRQAHAADLYLVPSGKSFGIGQEFTVDLKIKSPDDGVNAAEATINFPVGILELTSAAKDASIFNFWVEEPTISNENGSVHFVGGTTKGVSGVSLQVLKLKFKAKGVGMANLNIGDATVTASDGKGTNVLSKADGVSVAVGTPFGGSAPPASSALVPSTQPAPPAPIEQPQKVVRPATAVAVVKATALSKKPDLRVPLYPDQNKWYATLGETIVLWNVPEDVTQVAVALNNNPNTIPAVAEKELFTGKNLGVLKEGVWYIHVRFKNNLGWGETAHYKISLDTTTPLAFEIKIDNPVSDNPTPEIRFAAQDALSGVEAVKLFVDKNEVAASTTSAVFKLPLQLPGKHKLTIKVFDLAGNSIQSDLEFEILPLPLPQVNFVTTSVAQGQDIFASGRAVANGFVDIKIINNKNQEVFSGQALADGSGAWQATVSEKIPIGQYTLFFNTRDGRGAVSYLTKGSVIKVKPESVISFGFIELGWFEIALMLVLLIGAGSGLGGWYYLAKKEKRGAYGIVLVRDVDKLAALLQNQLSELETAIFSPDESVRLRTAIFLDKMKETIAKMKKYLSQEAEKLK